METTEELRPIFLVGNWMRSNPVIMVDMLEELPIGSIVLAMAAIDTATMLPVTTFQAKALPRQLAMDPLGNVVLTERVDYETIPIKVNSTYLEYSRGEKGVILSGL